MTGLDSVTNLSQHRPVVEFNSDYSLFFPSMPFFSPYTLTLYADLPSSYLLAPWPFVSGRAQTVGGTGKSLRGGLRKRSVPLAPSLCSRELAVAF